MPLPVPEKEKIPIFRSEKDLSLVNGANILHLRYGLPCSVHEYPYRTLPQLESHIHPKFVIYNAGEKIHRLWDEDVDASEAFNKDYPDAKMALDLYTAWIKKTPKHSLKDKSYINPAADIVVYSSEEDVDISGDYKNRTGIGRVGRPYLRPRTRSVSTSQRNLRPRNQNGSNGVGPGQARTPKKSIKKKSSNKKRKVYSDLSTHHQQLLSEAILSRFNQQCGVDGWTDDKIHWWLSRARNRV